MPNYVFRNQEPDVYAGMLTFCPHRTKPPDSLLPSMSSRFCAWLSVILVFLVICPRVGAERWSVLDSFTREYIETWLEHKSEFPRRMEGFELGFLSQGKEDDISVVYTIAPNNSSWLFVTPCSNPDFTIVVQEVTWKGPPRPQDNRQAVVVEGLHSDWYKKTTKVDLLFSSGLGERVEVNSWKRQELFIKNIKKGILKVYVKRNDSNPSAFMIRQYSGRIDAYYPRMPHNPNIQVCQINKEKVILHVYVSRAYNADIYCVSFNTIENLPNFCSAQLRISQNLLSRQKSEQQVSLRRPNIFDKYYIKSKKIPINKSEFRCFRTNRFDVQLNKRLKEADMFVNIYAINSASEFTDAYQPVIFKWNEESEDCKPFIKRKILTREKNLVWLMGNETVYANISTTSKFPMPQRLLYQSCFVTNKESFKLFKSDNQLPHCVGVIESRMMSLCHPLPPGEYTFQHQIEGKPNFTHPVGQLILARNIRPYPQLECKAIQYPGPKIESIESKTLKGQFNIGIQFKLIPSSQDLYYYFHIVQFPMVFSDKLSMDATIAWARIEYIRMRNLCHFHIDQKKLKMPIQKLKIEGTNCTTNSTHTFLLPELFAENYAYAAYIHYGIKNSWLSNDVQFYSSLLFTTTSEEEIF